MPNHAHAVAVLRLAADLHRHADEIHHRRVALTAAAGQLRWKSPATRLFEQRLATTLASLDHCAAQFAQAGDTIHRMALVS